MWPLAVWTVIGVIATAAYSSSTSLASPIPRTAGTRATIAVQRAVEAANAGAAIPENTIPKLRDAHGDSVNLGNCSAFRKLRSKICKYGDAHGTKTVVVFGDSHSVMWVPGIAILAKAEKWRLIPIVKEACGYEGYVGRGDNPCVLFYHWAKKVIAEIHPDVIVIGSYTSPVNWELGESTVVAELKPLTKRLILLSDTPWIPEPSGCLTKLGATQRTCLWNEPLSRADATVDVSRIAASERVQFIDVTPWFCDEGSCPSLIADYLPYYDGSHLTPQFSEFLASDLGDALNLSGNSTVQPLEIRLPLDRPLRAIHR
jgi:hypothetical protein